MKNNGPSFVGVMLALLLLGGAVIVALTALRLAPSAPSAPSAVNHSPSPINHSPSPIPQ